MEQTASEEKSVKPRTKRKGVWSAILSHWQLYFMFIPGLVVMVIFQYAPMFGYIIAWKDYSPKLGFFGSPWVGWQNLIDAVTSFGFWNLVRNTLVLGVLKMIFVFPLSIILALMFNEVTCVWFKRVTQTVSYLPYFISWVIINAMVYMFLNTDYGLINSLLVKVGMHPVQWYAEAKYWRFILTFMTAWKGTGWGTIVFLSGMASISPDLYEAAKIDGAGRWKQMLHVTLPGIMPIIGITFTLSVSNIIRDDFDMIYALVGGNSLLYEVTDVLGTWSYRQLLGGFKQYGQATAVGLAQGLIALVLMWGANIVQKKTGNPSMW